MITFKQPVHLTKIKQWSKEEVQEEKFEIFLKVIKAKKNSFLKKIRESPRQESCVNFQ